LIELETNIRTIMASFKEIDDFFNKLTEGFFKKHVPDIIAEKATEFFKQRFETKEWDGIPWPETKVPVKKGTLMLRDRNLYSSIKSVTITPEEVVISAGNEKVPYARVHNEGESIPITDKMRRFAWYMYYKEAGKNVKTGKAGNVYQSADIGKKANPWKGLALTKKNTIRMPQRRFMGPSDILNDHLFSEIKKAFDQL